MSGTPHHSDLTVERYRARLVGCVSPRFHEQSILVGGVGGGSHLALSLGRLNPRALILADPDTVECENLCRTAYTVPDLGRTKVEALADHLHEANPFVSITAFTGPVEALLDQLSTRGEELGAGLTDGDISTLPPVDLVIAGTDQFAAQATINTWSCRTRTPAVFIGLHPGAQGGTVTFQMPGVTPCYRCVAGDRYAAAAAGIEQVDLPGSIGTIADIGFIDAVALKIALGLLELGMDSPAGTFLATVLGRTEVIVRAHPSYRWGNVDPFALMLEDLPTTPKDYRAELLSSAYHALDTLWLPTARDPACLDCASLFLEVPRA